MPRMRSSGSELATALDVPRAMPAEELAARWRATGAASGADVRAIADPGDALGAAMAGDGPTVVAGSLYLVGDVRARLVDDPALRDPPPPATMAGR